MANASLQYIIGNASNAVESSRTGTSQAEGMTWIALAVFEVVEIDAGCASIGSRTRHARRETRIACAIDLIVIGRAAVHAKRSRTVEGEDEIRTIALTADCI